MKISIKMPAMRSVFTSAVVTLFLLSSCQDSNKTIALDGFLNDAALQKLEAESIKIKPEGDELATLLVQNLVENGPVNIKEFDVTAIEIFKKESATVDSLMVGKISSILSVSGFGTQEVGDPVNWFHAPKGDYQWSTHLSRHYWLVPLAHAWRATKDPKYSGKIIEVLIDWIEKNPIGSEKLSWDRRDFASKNMEGIKEGYFNSYVDGPWTSLSASARIDHWSYLLAMISDSPQMTNENLSIIFNSLANDHRKVMFDNPRRMNQFIAIATSLTNLSWYYPFLKGAKEAGDEGLKRVRYFADTEIYPDGSMAECSPNYSKGSLERVYNVMLEDQMRGGNLHETLETKICKAFEYFFITADPSGISPRIAKGKKSVYPLYDKITCSSPFAEYLYSGGEKGEEPNFLSVAYNWAGHIVFRSDWSKDATWMFFEPGPRGSGHFDFAQLNLHLQSKGERLIVDPGYYSYSRAGEEGQMRVYLKSSAAHNVALIDQQNQIEVKYGETQTFNTEPGDYHWADDGKTAKADGIYRFGFGENGEIKVTHKREVRYHREEDTFVITDTFEGDGDHEIDLRWQLDPMAVFSEGDNGFDVQNGKAKAQFTISCEQPIEISSSKGSKNPLSGWYSETYGELEPTTTVNVNTKGELPLTIVTEMVIK